MNMRRGQMVVAVLAVLSAVAMAPPGQYKVKTENGVMVITNGKKPDPPKGTPNRLVFEDVCSVGGGDKPDESFVDISALDVKTYDKELNPKVKLASFEFP
jgi:hypothetical protein